MKKIFKTVALMICGALVSGATACGTVTDKPSSGNGGNVGNVGDNGWEVPVPDIEIEGAVDNGDVFDHLPAKISYMSTTLAELAETSSEGVTVSISATITPSDAANQLVDWSLAWADDAPLAGEPISDYLKITTASDGNKTANLTCLQPFTDSVAALTVTTRDGGFSDTCFVEFVGIPSSISIETDLEKVSESARGGLRYYYEFGVNRTIEMTITLDNVFHSVSQIYYDSLTAYDICPTEVTLADEHHQHLTDSTNITKDNEEYAKIRDIASNLYTVTVKNTTLTFETGARFLENYYSSTAVNSSTRTITYYDKLQSFTYADDFKGFMCQVGIADLNLYSEVWFKLVSSVTGVSVQASQQF